MFQQLAAGLILTLTSVTLHSVGLLLVFSWVQGQWPKVLARFGTLRNLGLLLPVVVTILGLHLLEIGVWAGFYSLSGCFEDFETAVYYSMTAYTTVGWGDVVLQRPWRLVGSIESCVGVLLFGYSTAFVWLIVNHILIERVHRRGGGAPPA